jgi:hypothetical protein
VRHRPSTRFRLTSRVIGLMAVLALVVLIGATPVAARTTAAAAVPAPAGLTFEAAVLLDGHTRVGSWMAIDVHLKNDGPPIAGELRMTGGAQGKTRFGTLVDIPTQSDKTYRLYAQPPGFGREIEISLVSGPSTVATTTAKFQTHDPTQLIVGIVAERPGDIIADLDLLPNVNNVKPVTVALDPTGLPTRVQAWGALDRLIWQDSDSAALDSEQMAADHRRRNHGTGQPVGLPRRDPAVPTDCDDGRRPRVAQRAPGRGACRRDRPAGPGRDLDRGALSRVGRRSVGRRRTDLRQRQDHDRRLRPDRVLAEGHERRREPLAAADPEPIVGRARGW